MISYDNLWNVMKERGVTQYALIKSYHVSPAQITRLKRNESVSTHTSRCFAKHSNAMWEILCATCRMKKNKSPSSANNGGGGFVLCLLIRLFLQQT